MTKLKTIKGSFMDKSEWNYSLNVFQFGDGLIFQTTKDNEIETEVYLQNSDCVDLKKLIDLFIKNQEQKKPKSKAGRKKIYEGESETLSIHVPSDKKEFIRSIIEAILEPMKIKK